MGPYPGGAGAQGRPAVAAAMWGYGDPGGAAAAATTVLSGTRDCFLHLSPALASVLRLQQVPGRRRSGPGRRDTSGRQ